MRESKLKEILKKLTLDEKLSMIHGAGFFRTAGVERLGIPELISSDGPMGVRGEFANDKWISVGHGEDNVTYFPCNSALASTFNRALATDEGSALGEEARGRGKDVILAPGINLKRSPLCGRNFEYFSEDGFLTAELAIPFVKGVQRHDVAACVKHFAINHQETARLSVDADIDEDVLRENYLKVFERVLLESGAHSVMGAYNKLYGDFCCESEFLLKKVLRDEWKYDGLVISDWGGVHNSKEAALGGCDIEMSVTDDFDEYCFANPLKKLIKAGEVDEKVIDEKVLRILKVMNKLHMLDGKRKQGAYNTAAHQRTAYRVAAESIVLLKNEKDVLPLDPAKQKRVLVVGDNAIRQHSLGGGSAEIKAFYEVAPLLGLKERLGGNTKVDFLMGYDAEIAPESQEINWQQASLEERQKEAKVKNKLNKEMSKEVMEALKNNKYDSVIFVGGLNHNYDSEGKDRIDMELPYGQDELIEKILKVRNDAVIVLIGGSSVQMNKWIDKASSVIWSYYNGCEGGRAIADVIFGTINPSGKLPETFYLKPQDSSAISVGDFGNTDMVHYKEGYRIGYKHTDHAGIPVQFPFGYGLSYSKFSFTKEKFMKGERELRITVKNEGKRSGLEVVMVYGTNDRTGVRELIGFEKVNVVSGRKVDVAIKVPKGYSDVSTSRTASKK
ncbi:MAG: glycoside hydrolase family 3 C-terminal domain-containing protein [Butyrivibrio sp.]|nr:glycoside hydrolase family 3 C-terminal domain-containing protein [Butyrivibrio sp.]